MKERAQLLLEYADDELILGWRDSEWTGIAPSLEEDVAFSSIAQNEIGHARALYELADELRIARLSESDDDGVAGLAAKIEREETYHRIHAQMWADRLAGEPRFVAAVDRLWPAAVALLDEDLRLQLAEHAGRDLPDNAELIGLERGAQSDELTELWDEMTSVRRSVPWATW